jgi:hypothetical protein
MRKAVTVEVRLEDITPIPAGAKRPCDCPLAKAINRVAKPVARDGIIYVGINYVSEVGSEIKRIAALPPEAIEFRYRFDLLGPAAVSPLKFTLELKEENIRR